MKTYDAILVLGSQPDPTTWQFPAHIYQCLDTALELHMQYMAPYIVLSGDHALKFDNIGITQPFAEADKMAEYLLAHGCTADAIVTETISRDTLANYYYLKHTIFEPRGWRHILQVTADYRVPRLRFLCQKVLGPDYTVDFTSVPFSDPAVIANEAFVYEKQQEFLQDMPEGDDSYIKDQFYDSPMYMFWKQRETSYIESMNSSDGRGVPEPAPGFDSPDEPSSD